MNANRKSASGHFTSALHEALVRIYGKPPSAAKFADAFNLRAHGTSTISRETARKWLKGHAIPEIGKMRVLITWLGMDPASFLKPVVPTDIGDSEAMSVVAPSNAELLRETLVSLLGNLDSRSVEVLCLTAMAMQKVRKKSDAR
jgi:hypothetical protein